MRNIDPKKELVRQILDKISISVGVSGIVKDLLGNRRNLIKQLWS